MSYWSAHLVHAMFDGLRYLMWMTVSGFAVVGAAFYGGSSVHAIWQKAGPPARRRRDAVAREAEAGIAEIEAFLEARSPGTEPEAPPVQRHQRPRPPATPLDATIPACLSRPLRTASTVTWPLGGH